jgi:hypothetical protein
MSLMYMQFCVHDIYPSVLSSFHICIKGRIQDFKLGGGAHLKKMKFWGISCEKSRFYYRKSYFFQF